MANSFTLSGATPTVQNAGFYQSSSGTTPQAKALDSYGQSRIPMPAAAPASTPTTAIKKTTTTDPSGASHVVEYHAPDPGTPITPDQLGTIKKGLLGNSTQSAPPLTQSNVSTTQASNGTPATQAQLDSIKSTSPFVNTVNAGIGASAQSFGQGSSNVNTGTGIINNAVTNPNPAIGQATSGLLNQASSPSPAVTAANENLFKFQKENPYALAAQSNPNVAADIASGRSALLGQTFGKEEQALATAQQNALAEQGQQITAGNDAGNLGINAQGQNITAGTNVANIGTTQQSAGISGLGINAGLLSPLPNTPYAIDPTTGKPIGGGDVNNSIINAGNYQTVADRTQAYNKGLSSLAAADNLQPQIEQTIKANNLNNTPISAITNLQQWFSGQTSDPAQQQLSQQIATYINALGIDPATATNIASQQKGTVGTLLNSLYDAAKAKNEGNNPATAPVAGGGSGSQNDPLGIR